MGVCVLRVLTDCGEGSRHVPDEHMQPSGDGSQGWRSSPVHVNEEG